VGGEYVRMSWGQRVYEEAYRRGDVMGGGTRNGVQVGACKEACAGEEVEARKSWREAGRQGRSERASETTMLLLV